MDMGKPKNHKHRPMNSREAEHHQAGARQGPAVAASHSITLWCCPPSPAQAQSCRNLSEVKSFQEVDMENWTLGSKALDLHG